MSVIFTPRLYTDELATRRKSAMRTGLLEMSEETSWKSKEGLFMMLMIRRMLEGISIISNSSASIFPRRARRRSSTSKGSCTLSTAQLEVCSSCHQCASEADPLLDCCAPEGEFFFDFSSLLA